MKRAISLYLVLAAGLISVAWAGEPGGTVTLTIPTPPLPLSTTELPPPERYVLNAPAKFVKEGKRTKLVLEDPTSSHQITVTWLVGNPEIYLYKPLLPVNLQVDQVYQFEITEIKTNEGYLTSQSITKVSFGEKVLYDRAVCEVHGARMELKQVPTYTGLNPGFRFSDLPREDDAFPNIPNFECYQNCDVISPPPPMGYKFICPECVTDYAQWKEARKTKPLP